MLRLPAPAKVNLTFEVLGRRADGYHEVRTILQAISLADELAFEEADALTLTVEPAGAAPVEENLVLTAARLLQREVGVSGGAAIHLVKRIPTAGGLGGGSSDAATALLGLRRLWGLDLDAAALRALAARLGSDVPFFVSGGTALGEGTRRAADSVADSARRGGGGRAGCIEADGTRPRRCTGSSGRSTIRTAAPLQGLSGVMRGGETARCDGVVQRVRCGRGRGVSVLRGAARGVRGSAGLRPALCGAGPSMFALADDGRGVRPWLNASRREKGCSGVGGVGSEGPGVWTA